MISRCWDAGPVPAAAAAAAAAAFRASSELLLLLPPVEVFVLAAGGCGLVCRCDGSGRSLTAMRKSNSRLGWGKSVIGAGKWSRERLLSSSTDLQCEYSNQ